VAECHEHLVALKLRKLKKPGEIPIDAVYGPRPHSEGHPATMTDWSIPNDMVGKALEMAKRGRRSQATEFLDRAYGLFADKAEEELTRVTGFVPQKMCTRGRAPVEVWASLVEKPVISK